MLIDLRSPERRDVDLAAGTRDEGRQAGIRRVTRTDAYLLLLAAQNHIMFREEEWHWSRDFEEAARIASSAARTILRAMGRMRSEAFGLVRDFETVRAISGRSGSVK